MSDIHVLRGNDNGIYQIALHFDTPDTNNKAGVSWRDVVVGSGMATSQMIVGTSAGRISAEEQGKVLAGEVIEHVCQFTIEGRGSDSARISASLRSLYETEKSRILDQLSRRLAYFGHTESSD
jgi:hypothetical protein